MSSSINARTILWIVLFCCSLTQFAIRVNLNIAIVAMVAPTRPKTMDRVESECVTNLITFNSTMNSNSSVNTTLEHQGHVFDWDEFDQGLLLGSFFWMSWASPVPAAILSRRFGGKVVLGVTHLLGAIIALAMPAAAHWSLELLILLRFLQGIVQGCTAPTIHHMFGKWVPPDERGKFNSIHLGGSFGIALMYPLGGLMIDSYGWESVFYASGGIGLIGFVFYWFLVYDSPEEHPRISNEEREFILKSLGNSTISSDKKLATPWKSLLLSWPLWVNIIAHFGILWGFYMIVTQTPTFFKTILGFDIKIVGILSGLPHIARCIFGSMYNKFIADYLLNKKIMSRKNVRKLSTFISSVVTALMLLPLGFIGCDRNLAVVFVVAAMAGNGALFSGPLAGIIDLSPNFAGVSMGLMLSICTLTGFISPIVVGALTLNKATIAQWKIIWLVSSSIMIFCGLIHTIFATAEIQPWNTPGQKPPPEESTLLSVDSPKMLLAAQTNTMEEKTLNKHKDMTLNQ